MCMILMVKDINKMGKFSGFKALVGATLASDAVAALTPSLNCTHVVLQNTHASGYLSVCDSSGNEMWRVASGDRIVIPCNHTDDVKVKREAGVSVSYIGGIGI